jgi:hypothetical protein
MKSEQSKPIKYKFIFISNGSYKSMNRNMASLMIRNDSAIRSYYSSNQQAQQKNGDQTLPNNIGSFTKGFKHSDRGIVDSNSFLTLTNSLNSKNPNDFDNIILEGQRRLTNPQAGLSYDLEGKDSNSLVTPPPPSFSSDEMAGEIVENYWMALARDINFTNFTDSNLIIKEAIDDLSLRKVFKGHKEHSKVTVNTLFRGVTSGDLTGPYISQFFYLPIPFGASKIDSKMKTFKKEKDFMTSFKDWENIQNGFNSLESLEWDEETRYIINGRDLSAWVRMDVLYQAYFNAMLILMTPPSTASQQAGIGCPFNPTNPYINSATQDGFTTFGGPHICSLLAEVSNRALKHAWYHKWFVHLKLRPEAFGGAIHLNMTNPSQAEFPISDDLISSSVFKEVYDKYGTYLLPQAFPEGSPMHPSYPAGHATVAGACVTILKAFFDETFVIPDPVIPSNDGLSLNKYDGDVLTVGNELNKLASNVSFGRNFAGVHYRSDAIESQNMGEEFAISVLRDQKFLYNENFTGWKFTRFNGTICEI